MRALCRRSSGPTACRSSAGAPERRPAAAWPGAKQSAAAAALAAVLVLASPGPAAALNRLEEQSFGEFDRGSAKQFGSMTMKTTDFVKEYGKDLRLSNFTACDLRGSSLRGADLRGAYFIKAVAPNADFTGADLTDSLMDRGVYNNANFSNAVLARTVLTLADLGGANIEGADFTDALLDKTQQLALCKYAAGTNPQTGADTRKSLGCGGRSRGSPSRYMNDETAAQPVPLFEEQRFSSYGNR